MWLPAKFTINYIPKKFNLFYFLYLIFSYFKFTISIYMWPFFANIMYLHLFMLSESLLCESQLSINFSSWLAVKMKISEVKTVSLDIHLQNTSKRLWT